MQGLNYQEFKSVSLLAQATEGLSPNDVVIVLSGMERASETRYHELRELVLRSRGRVGAVSAGTTPVEDVDTRLGSVRGRALRAVREVWAGRLSWAFVARRLRQMALDYSVKVAADRPALMWAWTGPDTSIIEKSVLGPYTRFRRLHTWDFDIELRQPVETTGPLGVVLVDCMGPLHPDFSVLGIPTFVRPDVWFSGVRSWLSLISENLGEPVTIAAHPRARPGSLDEWYAPFKVVHGSSRTLLANSKAIIAAEPSTALGWGALYRTPIALISVAELYPGHAAQMKAYSKELGVPYLETPDQVAALLRDGELMPNPAFVERFMVADGAPHVPFWESVLADIQT